MKRFLSAFLSFVTLFCASALPGGSTVIFKDANPSECGIRCTLVSGTLVADGSTAGNGTIYGDPVLGGRVALCDGHGHWFGYTLTNEIGYALSGITAGNMYDLYIYWNGTAIQFDTPVAWTNATTPPTRTVQNQIVCKNGDTTRRLACSFYATGNNLTRDDSAARCLANQQNRKPRPIFTSNTDTYSYHGGVRVIEGLAVDLAHAGNSNVFIASTDGSNLCIATSHQTHYLTSGVSNEATGGVNWASVGTPAIIYDNVASGAPIVQVLNTGTTSFYNYVPVGLNNLTLYETGNPQTALFSNLTGSVEN